MGSEMTMFYMTGLTKTISLSNNIHSISIPS